MITSGDVLKSFRTDRGWSLRESAKRSGLSHVTISTLEQSPAPWNHTTIGTLATLADTYDIPTRLLIALALHDPTSPAWLDPNEPEAAWAEVPIDPTGILHVPQHVFARTQVHPHNTTARKVDPTWLVTPQALPDPAARSQSYLLISGISRAAPNELVVAYQPTHDRHILYRATESGTTTHTITSDLSTTSDPITLPEDPFPHTHEPLHVIGPVIWSLT